MQRGELMTMITLVCRKLQKGNTSEEIADIFEEAPEKIQRICDAVERCGKRYDVDKIYNELIEQNV